MVAISVMSTGCIPGPPTPPPESVRKFFNGPIGTEVERLKSYPIEQQYEIYRHGTTYAHPPMIGLSAALAERGGEAVRFLIPKLEATSNDYEIVDIARIFGMIHADELYDFADDEELVGLIRLKITNMKDDFVRRMAVRWIEDFMIID